MLIPACDACGSEMGRFDTNFVADDADAQLTKWFDSHSRSLRRPRVKVTATFTVDAGKHLCANCAEKVLRDLTVLPVDATESTEAAS